MIKRIKEATVANPELSALKEKTYIGWPSDIKGVPALIKPYWAFRDEISIDNRLIMKQHRIIIPKALQNEILLKLTCFTPRHRENKITCKICCLLERLEQRH